MKFIVFTILFNAIIPTTIYDFQVNEINGKNLELSNYKGKKIMIVNTASECGFTPQYEGLEALYEKYGDKLVIIGFPTNNFGKQRAFGISPNSFYRN